MSTAIANARLEKRFQRWDTDGNGLLEAGDFQAEASRIAENIGRSDSPQAEALTAAFVGLYEHLAGLAGVPAGQGLTREQFLEVTGALLFSEGEASFNRALSPLVKAIIGICDDDHNGQIDASEFRSWLVGTEGRLGGQARVDGVSGTWKELTGSVNFMAGNLT
ncbi:EF-hand domain-containing protein, partial [Streptomyces sp. NPDC002454]